LRTQEELIKLLEESGAILKGHFSYTSGRHGDTYFEKFRLLEKPKLTTRMVNQFTGHFRGEVDIVAGPTTGGVILSFEAARQLGINNIVAERRDDGREGREFKRGFSLGAVDRVLVVDDVLTTGGSIREVMKAIEDRGATVAGVAVVVDRTNGGTDFGVPFKASITLNIQSWVQTECPLCALGEPLTMT
jgi:orotate phosphoribosyltransferase